MQVLRDIVLKPTEPFHKRVHEGWIERDGFHGRFVITHSPDEIEPLLKYRVTFTHGRLEGFERVWLESPHPLQIPGSGQS